MDLYIRLKEGKTLQDVAYEIQTLNIVCQDLLVNGPIKANPESETDEGFLGDVNTPPNEAGIITVRINNYESLELDLPALPTSFVIVTGYPRRGTENSILPGIFI